MLRLNVTAAALVLVAASSLAKADNLVSNPNFAGTPGYGPISGWSQTPFPSGTAGYPYLSGSTSSTGGFSDNGTSGTSTVGFIQTYPGTETNALSQTLALTTGQTYEFSYLENARAATGVDPTVAFEINGVTLSDALVTPVGGTNPFDLVTGSFTATSSSDVLSFVVSSTGDATALLADVNVSAVSSVTPEPSSFLLLGTGLAGAVGMARRRFLKA